MTQQSKWLQLSVCLLMFSLAGAAQDLPDVAQGLQPYVGYHGGQMDQVSTLNGTLTIRIPVVSYPQKGSSLSMSYSVVYNSFGFQDLSQCDSPSDPGGPIDTDPLHNGCSDTIELIPTGIGGVLPIGPRLVLDQQLYAGGVLSPEQLQSSEPPLDGKFYVIGPDNAQHPLAPTNDSYRSVDESGFLFRPASPPSVANNNLGGQAHRYPGDTSWAMGFAAGTIVDSNGNTYTADSITDTDGNTITAPLLGNTNGLPATDSVGRSIPALAAGNVSECPNLPNAQFQPLAAAYDWSPPGPGGSVRYVFCYASVNIYSHIPIGSTASGSKEYSRTVSLLQSIVLPNNTYWGFIYDSNNPNADNTPTISNLHMGTGQLMSLVFPTGGSINYSYQFYDGFCPTQRASGISPAGTSIELYQNEVTGRTLEDAQGNSLQKWGYGMGTVTSPTGDVTVTHYVGDPKAKWCAQYDAGSDFYQGDPNAGGVRLRSTAKALTFYELPGAPYISVPRDSSEVTTLDDGSSYTVMTSYAPGLSFGFIGCDMNGGNCSGTGPTADPAVIPIGGATGKIYKDFDGSILKQDFTAYQWQQNAAYLAANLLDIASSSGVLDGSGNTLSSTNHSYDEPFYSPGGVRGHPTTATEFLNLGTSTTPETHTGWNTSGQRIYTIDANGNQNANGHTTDYQYNQCNGSVLTDTYDALNHHTSGTYDCNPGLLTSLTDVNGNKTLVAWDSMRRLLEITYPPVQLPAGGSANPATGFNYDDSQNTVVKTVLSAPNPNQTTTIVFDGLGREIHRYIGDSQGQDTIDTTYDTDGRVYSVSNPYRSTSDPTYGLTKNSYDALDRKLTEQTPDGTSLTWLYSGPTVDSTDEAGIHHQHTSDALGRLMKVMELGTRSSPLSLETDYSYDPLGNLKTVFQHGSSGESPRSRNFNYDSLSRLVTSMNPETGTICYGQWSGNNCVGGYDANGNSLSKTDARGVTTSYTYDALNRLTKKSYSDGVTNPSLYVYDTGNITFGAQSFNTSNVVGRLSVICVDVPGTCQSMSAYGYDAMGRTTKVLTSTPNASTMGTVYTTSASYDLAGNLGTLTYPDGRTITEGFDGAGRMSSVAYSGWGTNSHNSPYLTVASTNGYDPASHLINATMGNNVGMAAQYDNRERLSSLAYGATGQPLWGKTYGYSANSNLQSATDVLTGVQRQFGYDGLNRLTLAQDLIPDSSGAPGTTSETASSCTTGSNGQSGGAGPEWTNEDDSNGLQNPKVPGGDGWNVGNATVSQNSATAPDGSMSATTVTANSGSTDSFISDPLVQPSDFYSTSVTGSVWIKSLTANQNLDLFIVQLTDSGSVVVAVKQVQLTNSWQQYQLTAALPGSFNQMLMQVGGGGSLTSGQSIAVWDVKLEDTGSAGATVTNFLPYSQQFARWATPAGGITDNAATAPDGTQTAASFIGPSGVGDSWVIESVPNPAPFSGQQVTGSVWIRSTTGTQNFLLTIIEQGANGWSTLGAQTVSLSGDWQRFQVTGTTQSTLSQLALQIGGGLTLGSGQSVQIWGAQMELAGTAGPYVPTGATAASRGTNLTNLLPNSQQLSAPSWRIAEGSISASTITAPDGSATATEIVAISGAGDAWLTNDAQNPALYDAATVTGSVFLKSPGGSQSIDLFLFAQNSSGRTFLGFQTVQLTSTWQRFSLTGQLPNGLTQLALQVGGGLTFTSGQVIDVWGSQMELASSAGPYIATSALPVVAGQELKNILPNSQQLSGPSWGVGNGSITTNSGAAPDGSTTAATLTSAPSSTDAFAVDNVPNPSYYDDQTMTGSVYLRVPSGSLNTNIYIINIGGNGFAVAGWQPITVTSAWQRFQVTGTNQNGLTELLLQVGGGVTIGGGQTLQIWGAQMVVGTTPGSYEPTSCTGTSLITGQPGTLAPTGLNQTFVYDSFGNLLQNGSFNNGNITANNQFYGMPYDAAGNLLSNGFMSFTWDAESKLTSAGGATYIYDANGDRIEKQGVGTTDTFYFGGRPIARLSAGQWTDLIYGPNGLLAEAPGTESASPTYRLTDHLGNSVGEVGDNGLLTNPMDYTPFGQVFSGSTNDPYLFTGKERDSESGLDYFGARYYASNMGRWMSPDWANKPVAVPYSSLGNPQSLNLYSYVGNNPLPRADVDGHCFWDLCFAEGTAVYVAGAAAITAIGATSAYLESPQGRAAVANLSDAITNAVSNALHSEAEPAPDSTSTETPAVAPAQRPTPIEGTYEFPDAKSPGKTYVGQSVDTPRRLAEHEASGKKDPSTPATVTEVQGGKTQREMAETKRIKELGGTSNQEGSQTSNKRLPVSDKRMEKITNGSSQ